MVFYSLYQGILHFKGIPLQFKVFAGFLRTAKEWSTFLWIVFGTFFENTEAFKQLNVFPGLAESQALALDSFIKRKGMINMLSSLCCL